MDRFLNDTLVIIFLLLSTALLASCSSAPAKTTTSDAPGAQFSDLSELDYSPPQDDYRMGIADLLSISVFQADELSKEVRIDARGNITLPLLGTIKAAGLSQAEFETDLARRLQADYLQNPQVTVFIKERTNQRVTIEGEVKKSGVFPLEGNMTLLQAIALADGLGNLASPSRIVIFRQANKRVKAYNVNLDSIRNGKARDPYIKGDERIVVHRSDSRYWLREVGTLLNPVRFIFPNL